MNEYTINGLINLFSLFSIYADNREEARKKVVAFLLIQTGKKSADEFIGLYDELTDYYLSEKIDLTIWYNYASKVINLIKTKLTQNEQILIYLRLLELINDIQNELFDSLSFQIASDFNIDPSLNSELILFISFQNKLRKPSNNFLLIGSENKDNFEHFINRNIKGKILLYYIRQFNTVVVKYIGTEELFIESRSLSTLAFQIIQTGDSIISRNIIPIYYSDIIRLFSSINKKNSITFSANNIEFKFPNGAYGLHDFSFMEESGNLIAIMGGSGAGKTTLMNILNGMLKPSTGTVNINKFNVHTETSKVESIIGYIPQDDLLLEDLTVFQNLYYSAKLSFADLSEECINEKVLNILEQLELESIKNLKVGNVLNKSISGGQRKRLNIAVEIIREPAILLVDEPTSGLSSSDSEKVILLLREQANLGKIIILNIHQPSSLIFRMFDSLWILDKGGYIIFKGRPLDAISYFKTHAYHTRPDERECIECGALNPELIFRIIDDKKIDGAGQYSSERKNSPEEWHNLFLQSISENKEKPLLNDLPISQASKKPSKLKQFSIFFMRNLKVKSANTQYILTTILQTPLLSLIVAYFTRFTPISGYSFVDNKHLPFYIFMSVIVALFSGMMTSAEEIIKDRIVLKREKFLNLSWGSYLNSKILFLFGVSAFQTLVFVLIGNSILEINGQFLLYWIILFSASCTANMIGLNLSNAMNSPAAIYILIPIILIPQILLGGLIIEFDDMPFSMKTDNNVPLIGNISTSRWAFEALAVGQFHYNDYQKKFFNIEKDIYNYNFYGNILFYELGKRVTDDINSGNKISYHDSIIIYNELTELYLKYPEFKQQINLNNYLKLEKDLDYIRNQFMRWRIDSEREKDIIINKLKVKLGDGDFEKLRKYNNNDALTDIVKKSNNSEFFRESDKRMVQLYAPIYKEPQSKLGAAHFNSSSKNLFGYIFDTSVFNVFVLWFQSCILFIILYFNLIRKILYKKS